MGYTHGNSGNSIFGPKDQPGDIKNYLRQRGVSRCLAVTTAAAITTIYYDHLSSFSSSIRYRLTSIIPIYSVPVDKETCLQRDWRCSGGLG